MNKYTFDFLQTRRYDGSNNHTKQLGDARNPSSNRSKTNSTDSSTTESPDSTDYTSDEYLRLPEKMSSDASSLRKVISLYPI